MDVVLLLALVAGIVTVVTIVLTTKLDAFVGLIIASLLTGLIAGTAPSALVDAITTGFGNTLANVGFVIGLGVAIGKILEVSGAAHALARSVLRLFGRGREPWAMCGVGSAVAIPVFGDSAYLLLTPLARAIARLRGTGYATLGIALAAGVAITHNLVPPTPGPLAVAGIMGADIGSVILVGLAMSVVMLVACVGYAKVVGPRVEPFISEEIKAEVYGPARATSGVGAAQRGDTGSAGAPGEPAAAGSNGADSVGSGVHPELQDTPAGGKPHRVSAWHAVATLLVPIVLIVVNTLVTTIDRNQQGVLTGDFEPSRWTEPFLFVGSPMVALTIGLVLAVYLLLPRWAPRKVTHRWLSEAAASAGMILLVTGAGGAFGEVLRQTGIGDALAGAISALALPAFLLPFIIGTVLRTAQGSATVAMITAAGVAAPIVGQLGVDPLLMVFACITGAMAVSHYNDSFFWVVTRVMGLDGTAALKAQTGMTAFQWLAAIPMLFVLDVVL
ncbi:GntP family permease [Pseudonocardia saturnea]|uniref:Inner membrane permease YgbN n=3 Tax=Pseudonocardia TaxID=1847 RepID=A0A1Y2N862_PSEAH|nr:GntP family permease [Pseudonocardia saturnea]OSY43633.1 Inner membrane permease YgbN [Pseudonocardia autotrophica]TDN73377.1 GntP family gluconate:H+ symporter [Pseudonocardia autotrophica]BBG04115.1 GntP family transporter [Pseudonocardia autotrophica]GEC25446.1 GntP family transporter [Pseudonocardia saturnea]